MSDVNDKTEHTVFNRKIIQGVELAIKQPAPSTKQRAVGVPQTLRRGRQYDDMTNVEAAKSKLTRPDNYNNSLANARRTMEDAVEASMRYFEQISDDSSMSVRESEEVLSALSDLSIAKRILVNSIISPNDMISKELTYGCSTKLFGDVTPALLDVIRDHFDNVYKIKDDLGDMLEKALFLEGCYISVVLPESSIDEMINSNLVMAQESKDKVATKLKDNLGLLGTVESYVKTDGQTQTPITSLLGIDISDNFEFFKLPNVKKKGLTDAVASKLGGMLRNNPERTSRRNNDDPPNLTSKIDSLYPNRKGKPVNLLTVKTLEELERPTVGHPIVVKIPVESFIPVFVPGQPSEHVGGFILLDKSGNPIVKRTGVDQYRDLNQRYMATYNDITSGLIAASHDRSLMHDASDLSSGVLDTEKATHLYSLILEDELTKRLSAGGVDDISLGMLTNISRIMLSRACQRLETKVIFVPRELYSFLAFDYKDNGLGRSELERIKTMSSLRMVQEMADSLANIRNAIDHKEVTINLDPDDPDPWKTSMETLHNVQRSTKLGSPIGLINMSSIADSFQEHGWNVKMTGHEAMPDMSVDFSQNTRNYSKTDSEYADRLSNRMYLSMGISPDSISGVFGTEFATNVVSSNIFLAREALEKQTIFSAYLADFIIKYTTNSSILVDKLKEVIEDNLTSIRLKNIDKVDIRLIVQVFINNITIGLPKPDMSKFDMQKTTIDNYSSMLDAIIPYYISEEAMTNEQFGEHTSEVVKDAIQAIKDACMRNFIAQMNIAPELTKMLYQQPDEIQDLNMLHIQDDHFNAMMPKMQDFMARSYKRKLKADKTNEAIRQLLDERYGGDSEDDSDDDDYSSDDDYDMGDEEGGDDSDSDIESSDDIDGFDDFDLDSDSVGDVDNIDDNIDNIEDMLESLESKKRTLQPRKRVKAKNKPKLSKAQRAILLKDIMAIIKKQKLNLK